jgi:hypothetical protein
MLRLSCDRYFLRSRFAQCVETRCQSTKNLRIITFVLLNIFCTNTLSSSRQNKGIASSENVEFLFALNVKFKPFYLNTFLCGLSAPKLHTNAILYLMLCIPCIATKFLIYKTNLCTSNIQNNKCYAYWLCLWFYKGAIIYRVYHDFRA